jgi:hypothetical protein
MSTRSATVTVSPGGVGFMGALFLVFLVLQLTGVIVWSWWWVTAPLWGSVLLVAIAFLLVIIFAFLGSDK